MRYYCRNKKAIEIKKERKEYMGKESMRKNKFVILGGGPAGLTFANYLKRNDENDFILIEQEEKVGGLCRSEIVDNFPLDIGGGHFLDVRRPNVNEFLFRFMPETEWNLFERDSRIFVNDVEIGHPFEANIWQMPQHMQVQYLKSIAIAGCNIGKPMPDKFVEWIEWKLGKKIASDYMLPYNSKMFGDSLNMLGTYWLEKLPNVSFDETLLSCLNKKAYGEQPGHAQFYYPKKYGYGELWLRMGEQIRENILLKAKVVGIDFKTKVVELANNVKIKGEYIITTIPWKSYKFITGVPEDILEDIAFLQHSSVDIAYVPEKIDTQAQWIYYPDISLSYHRILVRSNFLQNARGYWTETNSDRYIDEGNVSFHNEYAYPLNTVDKPAIMKKLLHYGHEHNVFGLGRWGEHEHYNSDLTVERAINLAQSLVEKDL